MKSLNLNSRRVLLVSVALTALALSSTPAVAQQAEPSATPSTSTQSDETGTDIVVTGIRGSIERAQDLKRNAGSVIEAVTFEDLGKFSDVNIADSLQRVPGVQIQRNDSGEQGDRASIRGVGSQYVQVTVNDRTLVSFGDAGNAANGVRSFNLDQIPSEVIGGLTVYKSPIAETVEPGIGGLLNIATLRPLDYKPKSGSNLFGSAYVRGEVDDQAKTIRPRYSGSFGAKLFDNTLGIYVAGLISDTRTRTDTIAQDNFRADLTFASPVAGGAPTVLRDVIANQGQEIYTNDFSAKRRTGSIGIQWKPTSNLDIFADFTYNEYSNNQDRQQVSLATNSAGLLTGTLLPGQVTVDNGVVTGFNSLRNGQPATRYSPQNRFTENESRLLYGGINAKWTGERLTLAFDYGHSEVRYDNSLNVIYGNDVPLNFTVTSQNGLPNYSFVTPITGVQNQAFYFNQAKRILNTDRNSFRLDASYELNDDWKIKAGARHERTSLDSRSGETFYLLPRSLIVFGLAAPGQASYSSDDFTSGAEETFTAAEVDQLDSASFPAGRTFQVFPQLGIPTLQGGSTAGFCQIADILCNRNIRDGSLFSGAFPTSNTPSAGDLSNPLPLSPNDTIAARERNTALYASLEGRTQIGGVPVDGNVGLRAVNIRLRSQAFAAILYRDATGQATAGRPDQLLPTVDNNDYWQFLPNINLNFHPASNINIRAGAARSITLPEYIDTAPSGVLTVFNPNSVQFDPDRFRNRGTFGNANLKPISSWNFDLTAEIYTPNRGSIIVSIFYKDISDFIIRSFTPDVAIPGQPGVFDVTGAQNVAKASVQGFELGTNQPFTFLPSPFDGLGVQANYTFVDSQINANIPEAAFGLPGSSKHNGNVVLYYEKYGAAVRFGYTYRSEQLVAIGGNYPLVQEAIQNLDLNVSYAITKNIEINGSILNLTGESRRDYALRPEALARFYNRPTLFTFGARISF